MVPFSETEAYQECVEYAKRHDMNAAVLTERASRRVAEQAFAPLERTTTIGVAFRWVDTPEGVGFWAGVQRRH